MGFAMLYCNICRVLFLFRVGRKLEQGVNIGIYSYACICMKMRISRVAIHVKMRNLCVY